MVFNAILNNISVIKKMLQVHSHYKYSFCFSITVTYKSQTYYVI